MKFKKLDLKARINKANKQINVSIPRKKLSIKELDSIQKTGAIKILMEQNE